MIKNVNCFNQFLPPVLKDELIFSNLHPEYILLAGGTRQRNCGKSIPSKTKKVTTFFLATHSKPMDTIYFKNSIFSLSDNNYTIYIVL